MSEPPTSTFIDLPSSETAAYPRLWSRGARLLRAPVLRALHPLARRARAVAEPAGRVWLRPHPDHTRHEKCRALTVMSANLWHDWPRHRRLAARLEAFARLVELHKVDVILLQEVARTQDLQADEWLAKRLGMAYVYTRANGHAQATGFEEGLAVFSRFPLQAPRLQRLGPQGSPFVRRLALGASLDTPCGDLLAYSVHLGLNQRQNAAQMTHLREWIATHSDGPPALIGGDFNAHETTPQIAQTQRAWVDTFRHLHPHADGATFELKWPWGWRTRRRLDYLFLRMGNRRWRVLEARHLDAPGGPHSDHRAVLARLAPNSLTP